MPTTASDNAHAQLAPLAITAFGLANALGTDRAAVLHALRNSQTGLGPSPVAVPFETAAGSVDIGVSELPGDLAPWTTRTASIARQILGQAGMPEALARLRSRFAPERVAVFMGTSTAGADCTEAAYRHYVAHGALPAAYDFARQHTYGAILHVVRELTGARGPAWMLSTACTSSAKPFASAQRLIHAGVIDAAIVGGIDTLCAMTLRGFHSLGALAETPCRPFSAERAGISIGEGGALMVVERVSDSTDPVALLEGVGETSDAYHISAPHPDGSGAEAAMRMAMAQAGQRVGDVDYVNAHGTGTRLNDAAEGKAIGRVFGPSVPVVSTKCYTGHTLGGAGATEAALAILSLQEGFIPAALGADPLDEKLEIRVSSEPLVQPLTRVISNSFAFGGNNVSLLLAKPSGSGA